MNRLQAAEQLRRALQMFTATLTEEQALEIATVYPAWQAGWAYSVGDVISYGTNNLGDPQLYKVVQAHTSQADWTPDCCGLELRRYYPILHLRESEEIQNHGGMMRVPSRPRR